ncbi:exported hypothetical protein [Gammaproteobacteria bacterium]
MTMAHRNWVVSIILASLAGCAGEQVATQNSGGTVALATPTTHTQPLTPTNETNTRVETTSTEPPAITTVSFTDLDAFDQELSNALKNSQGTVSIAFVAPATINQIPPRLTRWLNTVQDGGGTVTMEPRTRSLLSVLFMLPAAYAYLKESALYGPVKDYNAVLSYNPESGRIQKFWFTKKQPSSEP